MAVLPVLALSACFSDPGSDSISNAPTCDTHQAWVTGRLDGRDQESRGSMASYSLAQSPLASSVDFDVEGKGHVHLEWSGTAGEGHEVLVSNGTFVSPKTGATYCVGSFSHVVLTKTGGQFELTNLKAGACPGTASVDGTIDGCFDDG